MTPPSFRAIGGGAAGGPETRLAVRENDSETASTGALAR